MTFRRWLFDANSSMAANRTFIVDRIVKKHGKTYCDKYGGVDYLYSMYANRFPRNRLEIFYIDVKNFAYDRLYPVHPAAFAAASAALGALALRYHLLLGRSQSPAAALGLSACLVYAGLVALRVFLRRHVYSYTRWLDEGRSGRPTLRTKLWAVCARLVAVCAPAPGLLSYEQGLMPALPLPALRSSVAQYVDSLEPLVSAEEHDRLRDMAERFVQRGPAARLQRYLWLIACFRRNWVSDWWMKYVYLMDRQPLTLNSTVANLDVFNAKPAATTTRLANLLWMDIQHACAIANGNFRPLIANGVVPLTASHYRNGAYNTNRTPGKHIDRLEHYRYSKHVSIYWKGCWYAMDVCDEDGYIYSPAQLERAFEHLATLEDAPCKGEDRMNALPMADRARWAENRQKYLLSNATNARSLRTIESSIVPVVFQNVILSKDTHDEVEVETAMAATLASDAVNRWPDKSMNYVMMPNGRGGGFVEHSWGDGFEFDHVRELLTLGYDVLRFDDAPDGKCWGEPAGHPVPRRLQWDFSDECVVEIESCRKQAAMEQSDLELAALLHWDYGKGYVKKLELSPDAWLQMGMQLAFYKDQGKFVPTYEPASARFWYKGRTETLRVVTAESCRFVNTMLDASATPAAKRAALHAASERHGEHVRSAMRGSAADRHLFALCVLAAGLGLDAADECELLRHFRGQKWTLSTSQAPHILPTLCESSKPELVWIGASFGPVDKSGYGVCYRFSADESFLLYVSARNSAGNTNAHRFRDHIRQSLREMRALYD